MTEVRPATGPDEVAAALALRYRVFCDEQGVTLEADQDGRDPEALLAAAERESRAAGAQRIRLHAQAAARGLYERGGFRAQGEEFLEEGIPHVTMEKPLA